MEATTTPSSGESAANPPLPSVATLREVVETLAPLKRAAGSPGELRAARWLADRLRRAGARAVRLEDAPTWGAFPPTLVGLGLLQMAGAALAGTGRRRAGAACAALAAAGIIDEAQNGPRIVRRLARRRRRTLNVVAETGDADALRTLVVLAHHDAAQAGWFFGQGLQRSVHARYPELIERGRTPFPQWWIGLAGPALTLLSALTGRRRPVIGALAIGAVATALTDDIRRAPVVPGANDNLSAVAVQVALAEMLGEHPLPGVRVLLVSAGAEETLQDGIRAWMTRHRAELPTDRTWVLNLDTVGSPFLILPEGEGPIWMEDYADPRFRDLVERVARESGIPLERGFRARASTDSIIPSRAGYPSALLLSLNEWRAPSNYHQMSDTPENLDFGTVAEATRLTYAVARALAAGDR